MIRMIAVSAALLALAMIASPADADTAPVGQWQLGEGSGAVAHDTSGFGDDGTLVGGAAWTAGPTGSALSFDGATGAVKIPDAPQLEPSAAISVAAWVARVGSPGGYKYILAKGANQCTSAAYGLYSGPNGGLQFYIARGHGTIYARSPDAGRGVWDGRWHLAVGTFDGTTIRLYVDGAQVGFGTDYPGPIDYVLSDTNDLFIGDYPSCGNMDFPGTISDVRIWDRALSASEASALAAPSQPLPTGGGNPPSTAPTAAPPGSDGEPGSGSGVAPPSQPVISKASLSASTLTVGPRATAGRATPLIAYRDSASSRVTFTILRVQSKATQTKCIAAARSRHRHPSGYCPRFIALGRFVHQDHPGRNSVRFPRALVPSPGHYILDITPSLNGTVGKTLMISFMVVSRR